MRGKGIEEERKREGWST